MKTLKILSITALLLVLSWLAYSWFTCEEWQTQKPCAECEALENGKMQQLAGTIKTDANNKMLFTDQQTGTSYHLIPCDEKCSNNLNLWFQKIGIVDYHTKEPYYFKIEGKADSLKKEFYLNNVLLISTNSVKAKLISFEGGSKIQMAKFKVIEPFASHLNAGDTITLGYYNYKEPNIAVSDTAMLSFIPYDGITDIKNYYICPDYDGQKGILPVPKKYIEPDKVKDLSFNDILNKYEPISEETFPLYEASVSEFRIALFNHFTEEQRKLSIPIKEVTWEVNDSTLLTIWFIKKQNLWTPIDQYQWSKGKEF